MANSSEGRYDMSDYSWPYRIQSHCSDVRDWEYWDVWMLWTQRDSYLREIEHFLGGKRKGLCCGMVSGIGQTGRERESYC